MRPGGLTVAALVLLLGGCALPSWVPFLGRDDEAPAPPPRLAAPPSPADAGPPPRPADGDGAVVDRIIAVVNNDVITLGELQETIRAYRQEAPSQRARASDEELSREFLSRLIETRLQVQEAEREEITVDDAEVEEVLAERMKKVGTTSREELEAMVEARGLTMEVVKRRLRDSLLAGKLARRRVALRVSVTPSETDRYLAENRAKLETGLAYHARHILVTPEADTDAGWEAARIRAEMVREQVLAGADFAELARRYSRDASAKDGGDLGTLKRGELAREIEAEILALAPGDVSRPYRSRLGYHLFRLESKEMLEGERLERARRQIRDILYRQKYDARFEAWIKEMKERAIIEVRM